jgi:hypothetical protein
MAARASRAITGMGPSRVNVVQEPLPGSRPGSRRGRVVHECDHELGKHFLRVTTWCAIRVGVCWPGGLALLGLPFGGAVGDQAGDGLVGLVEVLAASEVALEDPPLLVLGVGVLGADPF